MKCFMHGLQCACPTFTRRGSIDCGPRRAPSLLINHNLVLISSGVVLGVARAPGRSLLRSPRPDFNSGDEAHNVEK